MRKFLMSEGYLWMIITGLFATNIVQLRRVKRLLKAATILVEQRDDFIEALNELAEQRNGLDRILEENDVELTEFDRITLESNSAKIKALLQKYTEDEIDA